MFASPRASARLTLLAITLLACAANAQPQPTPQPTSAPTPASSEELMELSRRGFYDELLDVSAPVIAAHPDDLTARYLRGRAAYELGFFKQAESDLQGLGDYAPRGRMKPASEYGRLLSELKALCPPNAQSIRRDGDGKVLFRVYFGQDDAWTREIIRLLPLAEAANRRLTGTGLLETPVFLFDDHADFARFYQIRNGGEVPGAWVSASGSRGAFAFSRFNGQGKVAGEPGSAALAGLVAHEFNHCLVSRMLGHVSLPIWLEEGVAEVAGAAASPALFAQQEARLRRVFGAGGALSLSEISDQRAFFARVNAMVAHTTPGDPYAQAFDMSRFFLSRLPPGQFRRFLLDLRASHDFRATFESHAHATPDEFYEAWQTHCRQLFGDSPKTTALLSKQKGGALP